MACGPPKSRRSPCKEDEPLRSSRHKAFAGVQTGSGQLSGLWPYGYVSPDRQIVVCQAAHRHACHPQETPRSQARKGLTKFLQHVAHAKNGDDSRHCVSPTALPEPSTAIMQPMHQAQSKFSMEVVSGFKSGSADSDLASKRAGPSSPECTPPRSLSLQMDPAAVGATASTRCSGLLRSKSKRTL